MNASPYSHDQSLARIQEAVSSSGVGGASPSNSSPWSDEGWPPVLSLCSASGWDQRGSHGNSHWERIQIALNSVAHPVPAEREREREREMTMTKIYIFILVYIPSICWAPPRSSLKLPSHAWMPWASSAKEHSASYSDPGHSAAALRTTLLLPWSNPKPQWKKITVCQIVALPHWKLGKI